MKKILFVSIIFSLFLLGCSGEQKKDGRLKDGRWYGEFALKDANVPFFFEVEKGDNDSLTVIKLINGEERIPLEGVKYKEDSVLIPIQMYDTELRGILQGDSLKGTFKRLFSDNDPGIPFKAVYGHLPRFQYDGFSSDTIKGKWDIQFISGNDVKNNVGIFEQKGDIVTGSILTTTGDLRYLEGGIDKDGFRLSAFAGLSPYLIQGRFVDKDRFEGEFITARGVQKIEGNRNDRATLVDPYSLTKLNKGYKSLGFSLKNMEGKAVSLNDPRYKDKVVIVSILGSWCPNCLDEMAFLAPWYDQNRRRGVEVVGIAFERKNDPEYVNRVLSNLIKKYDPKYEILFGGKLGDETKVLPEIDGLKSYPTTIFIDKKGVIRKIHTGFNGPATGLFYEEFKTEFNKLVDGLLTGR
ncbi:MAG: TlpA disulfide reductase family protein [Dysgonomonas sp.]|nr:TlpA disulfide reductase family protein [Dysgonomonas sp.]